eukprot:557917-Prymnesium_polylepis.2
MGNFSSTDKAEKASGVAASGSAPAAATRDIFADFTIEMRRSSGLGMPGVLTTCTPKTGTVAVLGGSFDPITDGHLKCACEIVHARMADEVWIVCWAMCKLCAGA